MAGLIDDIVSPTIDSLLSFLTAPRTGRDNEMGWAGGPGGSMDWVDFFRALNPGPTQNQSNPYATLFAPIPSRQVRPTNLRPRTPVSTPTPDVLGVSIPTQVPPPTPPTDTGWVDNSSEGAFIQSLLPHALAVEAQSGIPAEFLLSIPLNERGWQTPARDNNYFGIKGKNLTTGASTVQNTWEDYGNGRVDIQDTFRAYGSPRESFEDFVRFLQTNPRYAQALQILADTHDGEAFIRAIHKAGYATDPAWSDKIITLANEVRAFRRGRATDNEMLRVEAGL